MRIIVISGPSCSGKTYLSSKIHNLFQDSILIKTDSYYRDNIFIKFLSIFLYDIYDRILSIQKYELKKTIRSLHNKDSLVTFYKYDFKRKNSSHTKKRVKYKGENQFLIIEGIFAHRLDLNYQDSINILCDGKKEICFKRRLLRDQLERGRNIYEINRKFKKSWHLFYKNSKNYIEKNNIITLNTFDNFSYDKLVFNLQNIKNKYNQKK